MTSQIKTILLLGLLTGLILFLGGAMGGRTGLIIALILAFAMNFFSYWYSDKVVLSMYRAQELHPTDAPAIHRMVEELAHNAGVPKPKIFLIPQDAPNAFATGRDPAHGVVAVTQGIVNALSPDELRGVLAHEIGHIANRDILIQSVAAVLGGAIMFIANMLQWGAIFGMGGGDDEEGSNPLAALALAIIAPLAATLIQMAISRSREYLADASAARYAGSPHGLASALQKLDAYSRQVPMQANPATENMFIVSPLTGKRSLANLFSTHPPIAERVERLHRIR